MIRRWLPALLVLVAAPACKKRSATSRAIAEFAEFADRMCACKDQACADRLQEDMTKWSQELAAKSAPEKPSAADAKRMQENGAKYAACYSKATGGGQPTIRAAEPTPPAPSEKITNADRLIKFSYDNLGGLAVSKLLISYVRADGTIDEKYGEAIVDLGKPKPPDPADDPNRPIGAPVIQTAPVIDEDVSARCPVYTWKAGVRTSEDTTCIMSDQGLARPKCSVVEVWKRAVDKGAPKQGLAVMELRSGSPQSWHFSIDDEPRSIHFSLDVDDTCAPTLEKPQ